MSRTLRVIRQVWRAEGVLELTLAALDGADLGDWEPGAHLTITLPGGLSRDYSLCGDPAERTGWTVAVLRERESRGGSRFVHERLRVGDLVEVAGPRNNFPLEPAEDYLLIAGGIGITPILAMARRLAATGARWSLLYCGRDRAAMAYLPELEALGGTTVHSDAEHGGPPDLDAVLAARPAGAHVYCCGPEPLLAAVEQRLAATGAGVLHVERFRAAPTATEDRGATFDVVCAGSGTRVAVPPRVSIVDALASVGVALPTSCREGICGTCETKVLAGEPDHRDLVLSAEEQQGNQSMMPCVSRCRTPELVLDLA